MPPRKAPRTRTTPATATILMTNAAIRALISRGVADALAKHEIQRNNNLNGNRSQGSRSGITRPVRPTRECTYTDFLKCQPMNFKGTKGVVGLTQWFERMKTVFNISTFTVEYQVKFATCTLHGVALTCWKSYVKIVGHDATYGVPWNTLIKMMTAKQNTDRAYTVGPREKKPYGGSKPLFSKYNYHHDGPCSPKCHKCNKVGHLAHYCRSHTNANTTNNQRGTRAGQKATCFECGAYGHSKRECPNLKNNNRGNQCGNGNAPAKVYVVGNVGTNSNSNVVT
nr:hypothetical protein [Tanacetum cinerariifolium]